MNYRGEIDGLRALAVVPVILFHAGVTPFTGGFIGVDVFFVISGYLISTIIINELAAGSFSILRFYERRARRILPALLLVMLVSIPFAWLWLMPRDLKAFAESMTAVTFFVSNFLFWLESGYFETAAELKPLLHTWSLAVEEQYYIIFPILLMLLNPMGRRIILLTLVALFVISFALSQWGIYNRPSATFFLLPARGWELLLGVFAAMYLRQYPDFTRSLQADLLSAAGLILIIVPIFIYTDETPFPGSYALPAAIGTALIILFARRGTVVNQILSAKPLIWIGLVSYSAYLWHQPVFAFYKHRFGNQSFAENVWLLIALSILLATLSFWIVERPFRRSATIKQLSLSITACFLLIAGTVTTFLTIVHDNHKIIPSYKWALEEASPELIAYLQAKNVRQNCGNRIADLGLDYCNFGDADKPIKVAVWGDSLAAALLHGVDQIAQENGFAGISFSADGCPPVLGLRNHDLLTCTTKTHDEVLKRILELPDLETVIITGNLTVAMDGVNVSIDGEKTSPETVYQRMKLLTDILRHADIQSVLVEQGPVYDESVAEYELQRLRNGYVVVQSIPRTDLIGTISPTRILAEVFDNYVETTDFFCNDTECPSIDSEGNLVIFDRNHVTTNYAVKLAGFVFSKIYLGD